jgi:Rieske Fe-S protein
MVIPLLRAGRGRHADESSAIRSRPLKFLTTLLAIRRPGIDDNSVIAGRVARGVVPDALWWDTGDPYQFLRVQPHRDHEVVIFGGEDHKTGQQDDTEACYRRLAEHLRAIVPDIDVTHRWSGQVIETPDGLPYIGQSAEHQYAATGYAGNGLTFGTLAGLMMSDAILGRANPWIELFDPSRKALTRGLWDYFKENVDYPYYMIRDRFAGAKAKSVRAVKRGQGKIIERNGAKVAAYRDTDGTVTLRSAICTHMGCTVGWNTAEQTWDCPCHGSRFTPTGTGAAFRVGQRRSHDRAIWPTQKQPWLMHALPVFLPNES